MNNRRHDDHLPSRRIARWLSANQTWLADAVFYTVLATGIILIAYWRSA